MEKPAKDGNDYVAGLIRAEIVRGKKRNSNADADGWYPVDKPRR